MINRSTSRRTASRPIASCSTTDSPPSSPISPSTAQLRRFGPSSRRDIDTSALRAARIESGFALYESLMTVTPSARVRTSIRRIEVGTAVESASATWATPAPHSSATAAAARALPT